MGATTFEVVASGETVNAAFANARREAQYECGHRGYTGKPPTKRRSAGASIGRMMRGDEGARGDVTAEGVARPAAAAHAATRRRGPGVVCRRRADGATERTSRPPSGGA